MNKLMQTLNKHTNIIILCAVGLVIILIACIINNTIINNYFNNWSEKGSFGDSFGLANVIISGLVFIGVLLSLYFQRQDLNLQREELSLTRQELSGQKDELKKQREIQAKQQFESTFFQLLANHHQILNNLTETWNEKTANDRILRELKGRDIFDAITIFLKSAFINGSGSISAKFYPIYNFPKANLHFEFETIKYLNLNGIAKIEHLYLKTYELNRSSLGHYYRNLFHIVKFVDEYQGFDIVMDNDKDKIHDIKYKYIRILRAQLSTNEIIVLWYNSLMPFGQAWEKYLKDYKLLKNVDMNADIVLLEEMIRQYPYLNEDE